MAQKRLLAYGLAVALAVPGTSALAAGGGHNGPHALAPVAAAHAHPGGARGTRGRSGHGAHLRQFEGTIVTLGTDSLDLRLQGSRGVTVTVDISATGTQVTAQGGVTTTAALATGEQVHVAATAATADGTTTYTAVRIAIQRRDATTSEPDADTVGTGTPRSTT